MICKRCSSEYRIDMIQKKYIDKNPEKYKICSECRKFRICEYCDTEFKHRQNRTCSVECSKKQKEISFIKSCGTPHNFYKDSSSRKKWEDRLLNEEGISNVFQRESVKEFAKKTLLERYGVDHISKNNDIKIQKREKVNLLIKNDPYHFKRIWHINHNRFIEEIGYDPRLHIFGKASKSSLKVFNPIIEWCIQNGIKETDIYIGLGDRNEYFIKDIENFFFYDFTIKNENIKLIIEFHGMAFHARRNDDTWRNVFTNETAKENIDKRRIKNNTAKQSGFSLLEIWEEDNTEHNIKKCKKFISKHL
jgi:hypothetical protein